MLENWLYFICAYAQEAHWIFFLLLMLAGFSLPISEDLILLTGGALASTCLSGERWFLYGWLFAGCWISAWIAYWIGRQLGPKLYEFRWFNRLLTPQRISKLHYYYEKFGIWTFIVGRFIPGGVRNALFMTSGLGKMPFLKFIFRDGIACLISTNVIFTIGYEFAENYQSIVQKFETWNEIVLIIVIAVILSLVGVTWYRRTSPLG